MSIARRYWRFLLFFAVFAAGAAMAMLGWGVELVPALLIGFDGGVVAFVAAFVLSLGSEAAEGMRKRAAENEPDHLILLIIAAVVIGVIIAAVGFELTASGGGNLALSGSTLMLAWTFGNSLFAIHYAHAYYLSDGKRDREGLDFPGESAPDYWDFAYYSFVLGMTFQVSDVSITSPALRRAALIHSLIAFWFNIGVVALTVSLVGDALK